MLISCLIPTYNRASTLERAVRSVLSQSYTELECLVIDDASTDHTHEVLQSIIDVRLRIIKLDKNNGVSHARNQGAREAQGEWLAFLDSDDEWLPQKLEWQLNIAHQDPSLHLIHGEEIWVRNGVRVNQRLKHKKGGGDQFYRSLDLCLICPSATMMKKQIFWQLGGFREDFEVCEDYDLWLKFLCRYPVGFVEEPVVIKYGGHADQLSTRFRAMDDWRVRSMLDLMTTAPVNANQAQALYQEICRKGQILSIGYQKHQRPGDRQRVEGMIERAQQYLMNYLKESP
jgi:glycosyltransferase involved in cell wall biosynthesis